MVKPWKPSPMTSAMRRISAVIQGLRRCRVVGWSIWNQRVVFTQGALWVGDFVSIVLGMMFLKKNLFGIRYSHCKWYILGEKNMITRVKQHINIVDCIYIYEIRKVRSQVWHASPVFAQKQIHHIQEPCGSWGMSILWGSTKGKMRPPRGHSEYPKMSFRG